MQLEQPGSALQRGQPAGLKASCARRALLPIAQVVQKGDPGLEPAGNLANFGLYNGLRDPRYHRGCAADRLHQQGHLARIRRRASGSETCRIGRTKGDRR